MSLQVAHVVGANATVQVGVTWENTENMRANWAITDADVVNRNDDHDLALLRLHLNPFKGELTTGVVIGNNPMSLPHDVARLDSQRPLDGEPIGLSGFPLTNPWLITTSGTVASAWAFENVGSPAVKFPPIFDSYIADLHANPGNSGGPAYRLSDGAVIAVCVQVQGAPTWGDHDPATAALANAGLAVLRPVKYLIELMMAAGVSPALA